VSEFSISTNIEEMDFELIYSFISESYWAKGIPRQVMQQAMQNSLCFALFDSQGRQIGFARMITDKATFAYLADVFIVQAFRGQGLSKKLMSYICAYPELQGLRRIMLATQDAHELYRQYGFLPVIDAKPLMQIHKPDIYKNNGK